MMELNELEQRILSELQEAGDESVQTLAVTVLDARGDSDELEQFKQALTKLIQSGFALVSTSLGPDRRLAKLTVEQSLKEISEIGSFLHFESLTKRWLDKRRTGPPYGPEYPYMIITREGDLEAISILQRRGYQWWRPRRG
jgi:hypothetical protein